MSKHEKIKKALKIVGPIILVIGIIITLVAIIPFVMGFDTSTFGLSFLGFPIIFIGVSLTGIGYAREMHRYQIDEHKENNRYMANYMMDGTRNEFLKTAAQMKNANISKCFCKYCGCENDSDASFCKECGKSLKNICPKCGTANDMDANFCDSCGEKLNSKK